MVQQVDQVTRLSPAPAQRRTGKRTRRKNKGGGQGPLAALFLTPIGLGLTAFTLLPIAASALIAFTDWRIGRDPNWTHLDNFRRLIEDRTFRKALINTTVFVLVYVPLNMIVSVGLAAWITPRIRGRNWYRILFFIPVATPMVANAVVWRLLLFPNGIIDGYWQGITGNHAPNFLGDTRYAMGAVILMSVWQGFGYNMLLFSAALDGIPDSVTDAAALDGVSTLRRLFSIQLPMISPALFFGMTLTIITSFQMFVQSYVLTAGGPANATNTMVMYLFRTGFISHRLGYASMIAWGLFSIIMLVSALQFVGQKRWVHYDA